jgi:ribonuclease J
MKVRIHRGAHEIGGSCIEVLAQGKRLVLDVGRPITAGRDEVVPLPAAEGLSGSDPSLLGVLITHSHRDHWGLADQIDPAVPIYMGAATHRILEEAAFWTTGLQVSPAGFLEHRTPFELGPFTITPFLNDHSAFDAYSLLVEADGRQLFYTGDIRGHGRKAALFDQLTERPPHDVDVLLMEGTNIRPHQSPTETDPATSEDDVERAMARTMRETAGAVLVMTSAQNIDRLVTIYRATLQSDRDLVMDLYGASIALATGNPNIPHPGPEWPRIRVYVPRWQRVKVKEAEAFERVERIRPFRVFEEQLAADRSKLVIVFSMASAPALAKAGAVEDATAIWSMWHGYQEDESGLRLRAFLDEHHIPLVEHHTSGHASVEDLQRLATAIAPRRLVPIHSFGSARFTELFANVTEEPDGAWWDV